MPARRTVRRAAYGVLAAAGLAGVTVRFWPAVLLTLILAVLALGWEVRTLRARLAGQAERAGTAREQATEHRTLSACLALEVYDHGRALGRPFPAELGPLVWRRLIARGDVLDAYELAARFNLGFSGFSAPSGGPGAGSGHSLGEVPPHVLRRLRDGLQRRGYYDRALAAAGSIVKRNESDERVLAMLRGEIAVTTGAYRPAIAPATIGSPVPGRVLHLVGKSLPDIQAGYTLRTHCIAIAQRAAGLDAHVVTQTGFGSGVERVEVVDGVRYHRLPGPPAPSTPPDAWLGIHVARAAELVRELRPGVLHAASDYLNALTAEAIGTAYGIPVVYESRGFWEETYLSRQQQRYGWDLGTLAATHGLPDVYLRRRALEDRIRRAADRVVTLAEVMAERIVAGGVDRERIAVVPNAVDVDAFPIAERDPALAARHGVPDGALVIGYISSLAEYEGVDTLITAYARMKAVANGPVALLIVGDGPVRAELEAQAAALGVADVVFTGQVPHDRVLAYYGLIDIFVVPRRPVEVCHLVTPLKPFEAFSTGRTVVLSDVRALASIAADSGAAELFAAGDPDSLARVLLRLAADPGRRRELADRGAAWVRAERTWTANARAYLRLYEELRAERAPRRPEDQPAIADSLGVSPGSPRRPEDQAPVAGTVTAAGIGPTGEPAAGRTSR